MLTPEDRVGVQNQPLSFTGRYDIVTGQADYRFAGQRLIYVGGYSRLKLDADDYSDDANMLPGTVAVLRPTLAQQQQMTHELRLASEERVLGRFDYTAGVFFSLEKPQAQLLWAASYLPGAFGSPLGLPSPLTVDQRYLLHADTFQDGRREEKSFFGSLTWHIDDKTELTGGGRYIIAKTDDRTAAFLRSDGLIALPLAALHIPAGTPCAAIPIAVGNTYPGTCDFLSSLVNPSGQVLSSVNPKRWTPKVYNASLSHRFSDQLMAYVNYGTAWRRGPTTLGVANATNDPVLNKFIFIQPENSRAWEIGVKSSFLDDRARVNLAVYRQTYDGFIHYTPNVSYLGDQGAGATLQSFRFTTNVPAIVKGVDLDSAFQITRAWSVGLAASYSDGHMQGGTVPCNDSNGDGVPDNGTVTTASFAPGQHINLCKEDNAISAAPTWNATLESEYSTPVSSSLDGYVRGLFTYYPRNDRASGENTGFTAASYGILNLYTGVRSASGAWDVELFLRNLANIKRTLAYNATSETDPVGPVNLNFGSSGYFGTSVVPLREFGVTARYTFGPH
jgi:iron complex outermembrane receptor protein